MVQREGLSNDNLKKLTKDTQQLAPEKEKQYRKSNKCWFNKKTGLWFGPNTVPALPEILKFPLLTAVCSLNHWSTENMIAFLNP